MTSADGADTSGRPANELLRRLNPRDFALISPHLDQFDASADRVLYNPGDPVESVHFPCGASAAAFVVAIDDGGEFDAVLIGREGAAGGIVSHGSLPAFSRITVRSPGPFVRLPVARLEAAKGRSRALAGLFARYADCLLAQIKSNRRLAMRRIPSSNARQSGSSQRRSAPNVTKCRLPMSSSECFWELGEVT